MGTFARPGLVRIGYAVVPAETPAVAAIRDQYSGDYHVPGIAVFDGAELVRHPGGAVTPLDTPAVALIKSQYSSRNSASSSITVNGVNLERHPGGAITPVDTPTVAAIKSQYNSALGLGPKTDTRATINGLPIFSNLAGTVPIETPEVASIKSQYYSALGLGPRATNVEINGVAYPLP